MFVRIVTAAARVLCVTPPSGPDQERFRRSDLVTSESSSDLHIARRRQLVGKWSPLGGEHERPRLRSQIMQHRVLNLKQSRRRKLPERHGISGQRQSASSSCIPTTMQTCPCRSSSNSGSVPSSPTWRGACSSASRRGPPSPMTADEAS